MSSRRALSVMAMASALLATALSSTPAAQRGAVNGEWRSYHGDQGSLRYSPLDQITGDNVNGLREVWRFSTESFGPRPEYKNEAAPLYVNGTLYMTAGLDRAVVALDPATGAERWRWTLEEGERTARAPRRNSGRGVSYWEDGKGDARIIVVTPGFHLVALDARTGKPIPSFGPSGIVDLKRDLGRGAFDPLAPIGSSSPVVITHDTIVVGPALELGFRPKTMANAPGYVRGFDVRTGAEKWRFHTIPQAGEKYVDTWENGSWKYTGNAGVWAPFSADDELGYVYLPVEAGTSDLYGGHRLGDNVYSSSLVCLDVRTGKVVWHFQQIHHDIWDYDNTTAPMLMDVVVDGRPRKLVALFTKQAFTYVFDRVTGEPIWPIVERPVPASDVPGERTAKTQPFPTKPPAFDRQGFTLDDVVDFTPEVRARAVEALKPYRLGPMYAPPSLTTAADGTRGTLILPGVQGGAQWEHGAADPDTGVIYIASATQPSLVALEKSSDTDLDYVAARGGVPSVDGIPITKPPYGRITAIDLKTGTLLWQVANGDTPPAVRDHPLLKGITLPRTGSRSRAGLLATRTLLFAGEGWGGQPYFRALDKQTGETVWQMEIPGVQTGPPMTYLHEGRQYIAFTIGDQDRLPAQLVAYALPDARAPLDDAEMPPFTADAEPPPGLLELGDSRLALYDAPSLTAPVIDRITRDVADEIRLARVRLVTRTPGRLLNRDAEAVIVGADFGVRRYVGPRVPGAALPVIEQPVPAGASVTLLQDTPGGCFLELADGRIIESLPCPSGDPRFEVTPPVVEWWGLIRTSDGRSGWSLIARHGAIGPP